LVLIVATVVLSVIICLFLCRHFLSRGARYSATSESRSSTQSSTRKDVPIDAVVYRVDATLRALGEAPLHISHLGLAQPSQWSDPRDKVFSPRDKVFSPRSQHSEGGGQKRGENSKRGSSPSPLAALGLAPGSTDLPRERYRRSSSPMSSSAQQGEDISVRHVKSDISDRREYGRSPRHAGEDGTRSFGSLPGFVRSPSPRQTPRHADSDQGLEQVLESVEKVKSLPAKPGDGVLSVKWLASERRRSSLEAEKDLENGLQERRSSISPAPSEGSRRSRSPLPRQRHAATDPQGPPTPSPK